MLKKKSQLTLICAVVIFLHFSCFYFSEKLHRKKLEVGWQHGRLSLFNVTMDRYSLLGIKWKLWVPLFICFECPISMTVKSMWMSIIFYLRTSKHHKSCKAELLQEGILFCTQFPSLGFFINKNVGFQKLDFFQIWFSVGWKKSKQTFKIQH